MQAITPLDSKHDRLLKNQEQSPEPAQKPLVSGSANAAIGHASFSTDFLQSRNDLGGSKPTENTHLASPDAGPTYGTLVNPRRRVSKPLAPRRTFSNVPVPNAFRSRSNSANVPSTPPYSVASFRDISFARLSARPRSAYDEHSQGIDGELPEPDSQVNGIRVWYSSFTSIDWLHDAIKDSARFSRLRRRKSMRSRLRLIFDKSLGWIIVTLVGFFTALVAFFVVRCEQLLFDLKEGFCKGSWWKAKRFCCPSLEDLGRINQLTSEETCSTWATWSDVFYSTEEALGANAIRYGSYIVIAVSASSC